MTLKIIETAEIYKEAGKCILPALRGRNEKLDVLINHNDEKGLNYGVKEERGNIKKTR